VWLLAAALLVLGIALMWWAGGAAHGTDSSSTSRNYRGGRRCADRGGRLAEPAGLTHGTARRASDHIGYHLRAGAGRALHLAGSVKLTARHRARRGRAGENGTRPRLTPWPRLSGRARDCWQHTTTAARSHLAPAPAIFVTWPEPTPADDDGAPEVEEHLLHRPFASR
jgi:hypothetical protein